MSLCVVVVIFNFENSPMKRYLANVFCLNPVHKYTSGVYKKRRTSYSSLAKKKGREGKI
jgi:hypothetical protein